MCEQCYERFRAEARVALLEMMPGFPLDDVDIVVDQTTALAGALLQIDERLTRRLTITQCFIHTIARIAENYDPSEFHGDEDE